MANPRCYAIDAQTTLAGATKTCLDLVSVTTVRPEVYDVIVGASATPADNALLWYVQRFTAAGTNTGVTPTALDPGDPASLCTSCGKNNTVEPTYTAGAILLHFALNQRATHRWIADPRGPLKAPATASNGLGLYCTTSTLSGNVDSTMFFNE